MAEQHPSCQFGRTWKAMDPRRAAAELHTSGPADRGRQALDSVRYIKGAVTFTGAHGTRVRALRRGPLRYASRRRTLRGRPGETEISFSVAWRRTIRERNLELEPD